MKPFELIAQAKKARENAYAPYSHFCVGAALLAFDGRVFLGCNVENAAYSVTCCAERTALFQAVAAGVREFAAIAIVGGKEGSEPTEPCYPCGVCRQALSEFCDGNMPVYTLKGDECLTSTIAELLPHSFGKSNLK
jgi:homotetrameric cytidine deaminase